MTRHVVESESVISDQTGMVILESDCTDLAQAYAELRNEAAKREAMMYAARHGLVSVSFGGPIQTFPVDEFGKELTQLNQKGHRIRAVFNFNRSLS